MATHVAPEGKEWLDAVGMGLVPGFSIVEKFGRNTDIDTGSDPEDVWDAGGTYTGQPVSDAEKVEVLSSEAADASPSGTGARTVNIQGLDEDYNLVSEDITLSGETPVDSVNVYRRVFRAYVKTAGSGGTNAGTVTIRHTTTTANVFAAIQPGFAQTTIAAYTIPTGKTGYLVDYTLALVRLSGAAGSGTVSIRTRETGGVYRARETDECQTGAPVHRRMRGTVSLPAQTDIKVTLDEVSDSNSKISASFTLLLVDD